MRINHNIAALNTYRQLGAANNGQMKSMEKLSSGLRINRAGDDAAGLAISEKMRGQIRGLDMAQKNAQDGISMIQTAEGALNETHSILQRMRELAVQGANDTYTLTDRKEIQKEMNQLIDEVDRIANNTEFNTKKLLNGDLASTGTTGTTTGTTAVAEAAVVTGAALTDTDFATDAQTDVALGLTIDGVDIGDVDLDTVEAKDYTSGGAGGAGDPNFDDLATDLATDINAAIDAYNTANSTTIAHVTVENDGGKMKITSGSTGSTSEVTVAAPAAGTDGATLLGVAGSTDTGADAPTAGTTDSTGGAVIHIGANSGQSLTVDINKMDSTTLGGASSTGTTTGTTAVAEAAVVTGAALTDTDFATDAQTDVALGLTIDGVDIGDVDLDTVEAKDYTSGGAGGAGDPNFDDLATDLATDINAAIDAYNTANSTTIAHVTVENDGGKMKITSGSTGSTSEVTVAAPAAGTDGATLLGVAGSTDTGADAPTAGTTSGTTIGSLKVDDVANATEASGGILSQAGADAAIENIQKAIEQVSAERSKLGAFQNRLDHTINNLGTSSENLTAAESRIRDVDMAKEMMEQTKNSILAQASQAMLAQANQQPQGVLQLLR